AARSGGSRTATSWRSRSPGSVRCGTGSSGDSRRDEPAALGDRRGTMGSDLHETARRLRNLVEPIAAGVYFAPEAQQRYEALGLNYFEGYFLCLSSCLGNASWCVVTAVFCVFKPLVIEQA